MLKNKINILLLALFCAIQIPNIKGQTPAASANFEVPELEITTTPEHPGICNFEVGTKIQVNETFLSYKWISPTGQDGGSLSKVQAKESGLWTVNVSYQANGVICSMSKKILVANLTDNQQIKQYFEQAEFWPITIYKNLNTEPACRSCPCDAMLEDVSFISNGTKIQLRNDFENFSNFQPLKGMHYNKNITNNQCLCNEDGTSNIGQLEESLSNSDLGLWGHQYFESDVTENGTLYIKAKMSWQEKSPVEEHRLRLNSIKPLILGQNAETSKQARIFFRNLFMTNVIGGYNISQSCSDPTGCYATGNYLTPSGIAVKLPDDATNFIFASSENPDGVFEGALIGMTDASGPLRAYHYNSGSFAGYYNDLNGELKSGFETILTPTHVNNIKSNFPVENNGDCKVIIKETELITTEEINFGGIGEKNAEIDPIYVVVSSQFRNADNKTVSFLSGNAKIISLPFKQLQDIKYVYDAGIGDVENVSSGLLWSFELVDELCNVENYIFDNVSSYKYKTKVYLDNTNEISVDKFVYLMNCNGEYLHYPIKKGSLQRHDNLGINYTNDFDALTGFFIPFSSQNPLNTWTYSTGKISDNCTFCPNDEFSQIIIKENYCEEPEHIFVEKIAQIATAYPSNFRDPINSNESCGYAFAQKSNWELSDDFQIHSPSGNSYFIVPGTLWPWHNYLNNNPDIRSKFQTDNVMFFQRMISILESVKPIQENWWNNISNKTSQDIICHLRNEDQIITSSITWDNKKIALNTLFADNSLSTDEMQCVIHIFASSLHEPNKPIEYLQLEGITIQELDVMFSRPSIFSETEKFRLFFTLSALAKANGVIEMPEKINNYLVEEKYTEIIKIESDIVNSNNVKVKFDGNTIILTPGQFPNESSSWQYNQLVPVIMEGTITIDGQQFVEDKNTPLLMPAIQVAALSKTAVEEEFSKTAWVALDLGLMFVGIGELRAGWAIYNGWKKVYIFGEIVGGGIGLTAQLINSTHISDKTRMKMQLAGLILSAPNIVSNLGNLFKTTDEMVEARRILPEGQGALATQLDNVTDNYLKELITHYLDDGSSFSQYSDEILDIVADGCNLQCKVGKYGCFAGDTKVSTLYGSKNISTVDVGDDVLVYDTKSKTNITEKVKSLKKYLVSGLFGLVLSSGDTIMTTENHPLWSEGEMKPAIMLQKGDNLTASDGKTLSITETFYKPGETEVYDLELNKGSNYYVSSAAIMTTPSDFCVYLNSKPELVGRIDLLLAGKKGKLMQDLGDIADPAARKALMDFLDSDPRGVMAWETMINHPFLRKDPNILAKVSSIIEKGHIPTADITEILRVNSGLGNRAEAVSKLLDDLDHFALYRNSNGFDAIISGLKADWFNGAGADGANWVIDILKKEGTDIFPPNATNFEVQSALGSVRRYDAVVSKTGQPKKFFEFKSYGSVPPTNFDTQFINDLNNPEITDLSQLEWIFDAAKNPLNFESGMKAAIDGLQIPLATAQKFGFGNILDFKSNLKSNFNLIFSLK